MTYYNYMQLRLLTFSWIKCSVGAPLIDEARFECAVEIASGWKTMPRNQARALFAKTLSYSDAGNRLMDFVRYCDLTLSVRVYGKLNGKEDNLITRNEMNLGLDNNILPQRYNQQTIVYLFKLANDNSAGNSSGIDLISFCFYDF